MTLEYKLKVLKLIEKAKLSPSETIKMAKLFAIGGKCNSGNTTGKDSV